MLETCLVAILASLGIVLVFWCVAGFWILPCAGDGYCVLYAWDVDISMRQIRSYRYLLNSSMIRFPLYIVDCGLEQDNSLVLQRETERFPELRFYSRQQWEEFLETERKERVSRT